MRKVLALIFVLSFFSSISSAQQKKQATPDKWDIFGGYSYSRAYVGINESPFPLSLNGGQAAGSYYFTKYLGTTVEFAGYTDDVGSMDMTIHTQGYLAGPSARFGLGHGRLPRVSFFANQLFGATHFSFTADPSSGCVSSEESCSASTNSFTMVTGGGVDVKLRKHISIRPVQMEYFTQQLALFDILYAGVSAQPGVRASAAAEDNPESGIKLSTNGFRYSGGVVVHF